MSLLCRRVLSGRQVCATLPIRCRAMRGKLSALSARPLRRLDAWVGIRAWDQALMLSF